MIRRAAQESALPFLNIVQSCTWTPSMRVPTGDEMRYLVYTTLAYGAQGISYYVYSHPGHTGMIAQADGTPTELYHALKPLNREFAAVASELQALHSLGVYHAGMRPPGAEPLPVNARFKLDPPVPDMVYSPPQPVQGVLLGFFGPAKKNKGPIRPTHVVVVNLDYRAEACVGLVGPTRLELFDATRGLWSPTGGKRAELQLPRGGGRLVRVK